MSLQWERTQELPALTGWYPHDHMTTYQTDSHVWTPVRYQRGGTWTIERITQLDRVERHVSAVTRLWQGAGLGLICGLGWGLLALMTGAI